MISLKDINKALIKHIKEGLKETNFKDIEFVSKDIKEGIQRPSFFIDFDDNKTAKYNFSLKERQLEVKIYYFAKDREKCKIELLDIQDHLENIFLDDIEVSKSFFITVNDEVEFDAEYKDGMLTTSFNIYCLEEIPTEDVELMEAIEFNGI